MRIGIDIDGVITDLETFVKDYGAKFCVDEGLEVNIQYGCYDEAKSLNLTKEQADKFWNTYMKYYSTKYNTREFASEVIKRLKNEGNEIYIITARNEEGLTGEDYGKMKEFVSIWLEENGIEYDRIIYTEESKLAYCVGNYIDVMVEDNPNNVKEISTKIPVLCMNCGYNMDVEGENITRVYSWYDVYQKINSYKNR